MCERKPLEGTLKIGAGVVSGSEQQQRLGFVLAGGLREADGIEQGYDEVGGHEPI
jgi:hypothetical protein